MGKEGKYVTKSSKRRKICSINRGSGDSDEDYVLGEEECYDSEGSCSSSAGFASEESFGFESVGKVVRSKDLKPKKGSFDRKEIRVRRTVKTTRLSDDEEEDDDDFDDEDDEEFMPDGIDCGDEDEEFQVKKKSSKARKRVPRKKALVKGRKRKRKSKVRKPKVSKRPSLKRSVSSDDDFIDDYRVVREKSRKKARKRSTGLVVDWDSDYLSPSSPEMERTVSDEEAELLREADKFCGNSTTRSRNTSLAKRVQDNGASNSQQRRPIGRKGKEKVVDLPNDSGKQVCGICFSEEGKGTFPGTLNCCSHYFCFACIMEWSKVESRCPLCKQRFMTISKPARSNIGIDLRNMVIQVPERDQVYQPSEEEMRGYLDPYENVVCMECQLGGDDSLMLLCDICDSSAHTYCVGLGREVPEGNWYCKGCRSSDPGFSNTQNQELVSNQGNHSSLPTDISTCRTIAEDFDSTPQYSVSIPDPSISHRTGTIPSPRYPIGEDVHATSPSPSGIGASTLFGRRRLHRQIRSLLSNNRMSQMADMDGRTDGNSHSNVKDEVVDLEVEHVEATTAQHGGIFNSGIHSAVVEDWVSGTNSPRLSHSEQLRRCRSRPFIVSDDNISPHTEREAVSIDKLQRNWHSPR